MSGLRCTMQGHEDQHISGICYDENCKAFERILCFYCLKEYHRDCQKDYYYTEKEMKIHIRSKFDKYLEEEVSILQEFDKIKQELKQLLDQCEVIIQIVHEQNLANKDKLQQVVQTIENEISSKELWYEGYQILSKEDPYQLDQSEQIQSFDDIIHKMKIPFQELSKLKELILFSTSPVKKHISCNWKETTLKSIPEDQDDDLYTISCSNDGKFVCFGGLDRKVHVWDIFEQKQVRTYQGHSHSVYSVEFSPDSRHIVSSSDDIQIWDAQTGESICDPIKLHSQIWSVSYSPNGSEIVSGSANKLICRFNSQTGKYVGKSFTGHKDAVLCVKYSPLGDFIVSSSQDQTIRVWNIVTEQEQYAPLQGHDALVRTVNYDLTGKLIISGSDNNDIRIWKAINGSCLCQISQCDLLQQICISPDGFTFASVGARISIWDLQGRKVQELENKHCAISACYSPDGNYLVIANEANQVQIMDLRKSI